MRSMFARIRPNGFNGAPTKAFATHEKHLRHRLALMHERKMVTANKRGSITSNEKRMNASKLAPVCLSTRCETGNWIILANCNKYP